MGSRQVAKVEMGPVLVSASEDVGLDDGPARGSHGCYGLGTQRGEGGGLLIEGKAGGV